MIPDSCRAQLQAAAVKWGMWKGPTTHGGIASEKFGMRNGFKCMSEEWANAMKNERITVNKSRRGLCATSRAHLLPCDNHAGQTRSWACRRSDVALMLP
ncbi:hypothetical protein N9L68_06990 [bacterium]|nr:hypothetical protein [bacterium]